MRTGTVVGMVMITVLAAAAIPAGAEDPSAQAAEAQGAGAQEGWTRRRGAMFVPPVPAGSAASSRAAAPTGSAERGASALPGRTAATDRGPTLIINDAAFDPTTVYVRHGDEWVNVAIALGLPGRRALPTLPPYIQVQQAPIPEEPRGEWGR